MNACAETEGLAIDDERAPVWIGARGQIYRRLSIGRRGDGVFSLKVADWN